MSGNLKFSTPNKLNEVNAPMNELEKRVEAILNAPLGCMFMLGVEASGLTPEAAAEPENCLRLAPMAVDSISPWTDGHAQAVAEALERGGRLKDLARSILEHPASSWWFQPPDLERQCWIYKAAWPELRQLAVHRRGASRHFQLAQTGFSSKRLGKVRAETPWKPGHLYAFRQYFV